MPTNIPIGSPLARKVYGAALFAAISVEPGFMNLLTGPAPQQSDAEANLSGDKKQTSSDYPVVRVTDLAKGAGDKVTADMFNPLQGKPTMGDRKIQGRLMSLSSSTMEVQINQYRAGADGGGRMSQQRTVWNLRDIAQAGLRGHAGKIEDQITLVQMAGARGYQNNIDWVVPLASDADFADIMVNTVKAPTANRQFYANDATAVDNLDTSDVLKLTDFDRVASVLRDSVVPLQAVKVKGDVYGWNDPLWVVWLTERQWLYLKTQTGERSWRTFLQNAYERRSAGMRHPLFYGDNTGMWAGMLIKQMNRMAIRFPAGSSVNVCLDPTTETETTKTASVDTDRAVIMGAQAVIKAYGKHKDSEYHASWYEELTDHGNSVEMSYAMMGGCAKSRFKFKTGTAEEFVDYGVAVIDSYAPDPQTTAGKALLA